MKTYTLLVLLFVAFHSFGQSHVNRHSSVTQDAWLSCTPSPNPNPMRGNSHWIRYDLGTTYPLQELQLWNFNHPDSLNMGIMNAFVDLSMDGINWQESANIVIPQGTGNSMFTGSEAFDFNGVAARYLLITSQSTYGGNCAGLSEMKIAVGDANLPVSLVNFNVACRSGSSVVASWKTEQESNMESYEVLGSVDLLQWTSLSTQKANNKSEKQEYTINLPDGTDYPYFKLANIDNDGLKEFSEIVFNECVVLEQLTVDPNPSTLNATLTGLQSGHNTIDIVDSRGNIVERLSTQGKNSMVLNLSNLPSGLYFARAYGNAPVVTTKIIHL